MKNTIIVAGVLSAFISAGNVQGDELPTITLSEGKNEISISVVNNDINDGRSYFSSHAMAARSGNVYDACLKVDTDANPDETPHT